MSLRQISVLASVPDGFSRDTTRVRVVGMLDDGSFAVAVMTAGAGQAEAENEFRIDDVVKLAEACLSGDRRALTQPGLARYLCGAVLVLAKAGHAAGIFVEDLPLPDAPAEAEGGGDE